MTPQRRVPDLFVEQLHRGDLSPERAAVVQRQLEAEPGGLDRLAALAASDEQIRADIPADAVAREVRARLAEREVVSTQPRFFWRSWMPVVAAAVVAMFAIVGGDALRSSGGVDAVPTERTKGDAEPALVLYRKGFNAAVPLGPAEAVHPGDLLQVAYIASGAEHGVIFSVDGHGVVSLHHPASAVASTALEVGGEVLLGHAYELDDAPEHETFYFLTSSVPIDVNQTLEDARDGARRARFVDTHGKLLEPLVRRLAKEGQR